MGQTLVHYRFGKTKVPSFYFFLLLVGWEWLLDGPILQCSWAYGHWCPERPVTWEVCEEMVPISPSGFCSTWGTGNQKRWLFADPHLPLSPVYHPVGWWHCFMMLKPSAGTMLRQSEGRYEAAELSWTRRRATWLKNLGQLRNHSSSLLEWAHFLHKSWDPRQEAGASRRWGLPEKGEALTHHSAAEKGLQAMWGWRWCEDIPISNFWDSWACWRSSHPSLLPCGLTARKTFSSLCSWSQSAESPRNWKKRVAQIVHRQRCLSPWRWLLVAPTPSWGSPRWFQEGRFITNPGQTVSGPPRCLKWSDIGETISKPLGTR